MGVATASGSMRSLRTLSCGQNGDSSAGPLAKAEARGAAGARGCGESPGAGALGTAKRHPWWALSGLRVSHRPCPGGSLGRAARAHLWGGARGGRGPSGGLSGRACAVARDLDVYGPVRSQGLDTSDRQKCVQLPARPEGLGAWAWWCPALCTLRFQGRALGRVSGGRDKQTCQAWPSAL